MPKENGRFKPADEKEVAAVRGRGKSVMCSICGHTNRVIAVFGKDPVCSQCDQLLQGEGND